MKYKFAICLLIYALMLMSGCPLPRRETAGKLICPGKPTIDEAAGLLALQKQNVQPFKATADCIISLPDEKGKLEDQKVDGVLYFVPPDKLLFAGEKFGKVNFGANETEFWMLVKPDIDTYWWGTKEQAQLCRKMFAVNVSNITEALGIVDVTTDWTLWHRENYDILDRIQDGKREKRVYINTCDYRISLIEYFDEWQAKEVTIELSDYSLGRQGIIVPKVIRISYYGDDGRQEARMEIQLKQIVPFIPSQKQEKMFVRPPSDGYKEVYQLNEVCEFELQDE